MWLEIGGLPSGFTYNETEGKTEDSWLGEAPVILWVDSFLRFRLFWFIDSCFFFFWKSDSLMSCNGHEHKFTTPCTDPSKYSISASTTSMKIILVYSTGVLWGLLWTLRGNEYVKHLIVVPTCITTTTIIYSLALCPKFHFFHGKRNWKLVCFFCCWIPVLQHSG